MKQSNISATIIMSIISFASCTNDIENLDIIPTNNGQNTEGNITTRKKSKSSLTLNKEVHIKQATNQK